MPNIGMTELAVILGIAVLIFGAKRLPEAARGLGQSFNAFKTGLKDVAGETPAEDKKI
ncbi:MAG: twin-arginine translocase TatA/TatE family subunit [Elusimicrobia bacterium]|nr:twin-arginine translocase TatA/TatE family subunit [Elusimicrobiota bacterium]